MNINDTIMVDIDGNIVPCTILDIEYIETPPQGGDGALPNNTLDRTLGPIPHSIKLLDTGSGRHFWRSYEVLRASKRFDGQIVTYHGYMDWLKSNRPDITIKFGRPSGYKAAQQPREKKTHFSDRELAVLLHLLNEGKLS